MNPGESSFALCAPYSQLTFPTLRATFRYYQQVQRSAGGRTHGGLDLPEAHKQTHLFTSFLLRVRDSTLPSSCSRTWKEAEAMNTKREAGFAAALLLVLSLEKTQQRRP